MGKPIAALEYFDGLETDTIPERLKQVDPIRISQGSVDMNEIICPHCGKAFTIDEAGYADIVNQVRDSEFDAAAARAA